MDVKLDGNVLGQIPDEYKKIDLSSITTPISFTTNLDNVDDKERGYLIHNGSEWDFILPNTYALLDRDGAKNLALILESPHKYEFKNNGVQFKPQEPALGPTGIKIRGGITKRNFIKLLDPNHDYEVKLINAIQFQCSSYNQLHTQKNKYNKDDDLRDDVFRLLWNEGDLKTNFIYRLKNYEPVIIVNCCTGGVDAFEKAISNNDVLDKPLNWYVHQQLVDSEYLTQAGFKQDDNYFIDNHPSSWDIY